MKSLFTFLISIFMSFAVNAEVIYFWLNNEDIRYENMLLYSDERTFTTFITYNDNGDMVTKQLNVKKAKASDIGASGNRDVRISDFGNIDSIDGVSHWLEEGIGSNGKKSIIYQIDLGEISLDDYTSAAFMIELDGYNGTDYYGKFLASDLKNHFYTKDMSHICGGISLYEASVPEPNSFLLLLIGTGFILLRRKKYAYTSLNV